MIYDKINNINIYNNIPDDVVNFVKSLNSHIKPGRYNISNSAYANVEEYITRNPSDAKYEAHKNYIDIQILLSGKEIIYIEETKNLSIDIKYDTEKDIMFFSESVIEGLPIVLDGTNFVVIYPHEAHAPQVICGSGQKVLKVVIKIKI